MSQRKNRRSIRLRGYDYSQAGGYFITICTKNRECLLGEIKNGELKISNSGKIVSGCWSDLVNHYPNIKLDSFVVMPNHVHGIIMIDEMVGAIHELPVRDKDYRIQRRQMLIPKMIGRFKMISSKRINQIRDTSNISAWQRNYYEHLVRDEESLNRIREYIKYNPRSWDLDRENPNRIGIDNFNIWFESRINR